ncbi:MAG: hypothetical protein ACI31G_02485 [Bacilli bacterium]
MKKRNYIFLLLSLLSLSSCVKTDPFEVNGLAIINEQEAVYVSNQATNNLFKASKLVIEQTTKVDKRKVYSGAAKQYAEYKTIEENSTLNIYSNYAYSLHYSNYSLYGNGLEGSYYSEYEIDMNEWVDVSITNPGNYDLYSSISIKNPNSKIEKISSSSIDTFSSFEEVDIKWRMNINELLSDGYTYSSYSYGTKDNKLYAFSQSVDEGLIANPLHPEEQIIIFNEIMRVRSFKKDSNLGWVIDYSAEKNNIYHITSLTGDIYESPILVEENEKVMTYSYDSKKAVSFSFVEEESRYIPVPYLAVYDDSLIELSRTRINLSYTSIYDDNYTYAISYLNFSKDEIYSFITRNNGEDTKYGFPYFSRNDLNIIYNDLDIEDSLSYFKSHYNTKLLILFSFDRSGQIVDIETLFISLSIGIN